MESPGLVKAVIRLISGEEEIQQTSPSGNIHFHFQGCLRLLLYLKLAGAFLPLRSPEDLNAYTADESTAARLEVAVSDGAEQDEHFRSSLDALVLEAQRSSEISRMVIRVGDREILKLATESTEVEALSEIAFSLGLLFSDRGEFELATLAYIIAMESGHQDRRPMGAINLGALREKAGDLVGAEEAYQLAVDSWNADFKQIGSIALGSLRERAGDLAGAQALFQQVIDSGHDEFSPLAAISVGNLRRRTGDFRGAEAAFLQAIGSGHGDWATEGALLLGTLAETEGDLRKAEGAYLTAIDFDHAEHSPRAAFCLGLLLKSQGHRHQAMDAFGIAMRSGHKLAPVAAFNVGILREELNEPDVTAAYQVAIDHGDQQTSAMASFGLGVYLANRGENKASAEAFEQALSFPELTARAAHNLGLVLSQLRDLPGARAAWEIALKAGDSRIAASAERLSAQLDLQED